MKTGRWSRREISLAAAAALIAAGCGLVAVLLSLEPGLEAFPAGVMLGTLFGQVSLAAAWTALGPLRLVVRLPLAAAWIAGLILLVAAGEDQMQLQGLLILGGAFSGQWLLVQIPLWMLVRIYGLRIALEGEAAALSASDQQFGIRQLMILTAIVAVVFGAGRLLLGGLKWDTNQGNDFFEIARAYAVIVAVNALITLPILAAVLLPRRAAAASILAVLFALAMAGVELSLLHLLAVGGPRELWPIIVTKNVVQCAWVLPIVAILRAGGYRLVSRSPVLAGMQA